MKIRFSGANDSAFCNGGPTTRIADFSVEQYNCSALSKIIRLDVYETFKKSLSPAGFVSPYWRPRLIRACQKTETCKK